MPRILPLELDQATGDARIAYEQGLARWGRMTNMKRTLLQSPAAYHALMEWYTLFDTIKPFLGERLAIIFAHAISSESNCLICTTFMRRILISWGEDPSNLRVNDVDDEIIDFGRAIVRPGNRVPEVLFKKLAARYSADQLVALTAFASLMVATNIINNVLEVDLDEYLYEFRASTPNAKESEDHDA